MFKSHSISGCYFGATDTVDLHLLPLLEEMASLESSLNALEQIMQEEPGLAPKTPKKVKKFFGGKDDQ